MMSEQTVYENVAEYFGCNVFNDVVMRERLPKSVYKAVVRTKEYGTALDPEVADVVHPPRTARQSAAGILRQGARQG